MSLPLTPARIAAVYDMLRAWPPFCRWGLPPAAEIKFKVFRHREKSADCDGATIRVSVHHNGHLDTAVATVAHEMIHHGLKIRGHKDWHVHGAKFQRIAKSVARRYGWDPLTF